MKIYITKCIALIVSFWLVMPGMPAFGNTFLAPPALNELIFQRSMQDAEGIPEEILNEASSVDDLIAYIWQQNKQKKYPLGINLEQYPEQHGQFAIYYLIKDLRLYFEGWDYYIDPGPQKFSKRVNRIIGKKLFKWQPLTTNVFFRVKEVFGRLCAKGQLGTCNGLGRFLAVIEEDPVLSDVNLGYLTAAVGKQKKFADLLGVDEADIPEDWHIPYIHLAVKQLKALRDLFKPIIKGADDVRIEDCKRLGSFLAVIEKNAVLSEVNLGHLTIAVCKREKFANLLGVKKADIPEDWYIPNINLTIKQLKALRHLFKPKVTDGSIKDCKQLSDFLSIIEEDPVLSDVHLGHLTGAVGTREKFADLLGVDEAEIPKDWNIPFINLTVKQLKALRDLFKPIIEGVGDVRIEDCKRLGDFLKVIEEDTVLSDVNLGHLTGAVCEREKFADLLGVKIADIPEDWHIPHIHLAVKQLKALRDLFKPKVTDGSIKDCKRLGGFLKVIEEDAILSDVNLGYLTAAVGKQKKFADLLGVNEADIPEDWYIPNINLTVKQLKALRHLFKPKVTGGSIKDCKRLSDFLSVIEEDPVLSDVNLGQLTSAVDKRKKFADLLGVDEAGIPEDWHISFINLTVKQLKALRDLFKPKVTDGSIKDCKRLGGFLKVIEEDAILSDVNLGQLTRAVGEREKFADLLGVNVAKIPADWYIPKISLTVKQLKALRDLFKPKISSGKIKEFDTPDKFRQAIKQIKILSRISITELMRLISNYKLFAELIGVDEEALYVQWDQCFRGARRNLYKAAARAH